MAAIAAKKEADAKKAQETLEKEKPSADRYTLLQLQDVLKAVGGTVAWAAACDDADRTEQDRVELSVLHQSLLTAADTIAWREPFQLLRNQDVGGVRVDFYAPEWELVVEVDCLNRPPRHLRARALGDVDVIVVPYWTWRRAVRTRQEKAYLMRLLADVRPALRG